MMRKKTKTSAPSHTDGDQEAASSDTQDAILRQHRLPTSGRRAQWVGMAILLVAFGGFGSWAALAPLSVAVVAGGSVSVESFKKTVQHLEGGIVAAINVEDGDDVEAGDTLMVLDDTQARAQLDIARANAFIAGAQEARLLAEQRGDTDLAFSQALREMAQGNERFGQILDVQRSLFFSRRSSLQGEIASLEQQIRQFHEQIDGLRQTSGIDRQRIDSLRAEIEDYQSLFKEGLGNNQRIRELQRQVLQFESDIAQAKAQIAQLQSRISENRSRIETQRQHYQRELGEQLRQAQAQLADASERSVALRDQVRRTRILAPVTGTVVGLDIHTISAVVQGGEPLMSIVPKGGGFLIEARISSQDIDSIYPGQPAEIRFSAFNQRRAPVVAGEVEHVSADSFEDESTGVSYYRALLRVSPSGKKEMTDDMRLLSGMPAEVMIQTGEKTLLDYLIQPVVDMLHRAMRQD